ICGRTSRRPSWICRMMRSRRWTALRQAGARCKSAGACRGGRRGAAIDRARDQGYGRETARGLRIMEAPRRLTFDCYTLDLANEQLLCEGEVVPLTPKAFAVLRRLVEDAGQLVTKEELLRAGWADTHVTEGVLKANVLELRRALADDAAAPRF